MAAIASALKICPEALGMQAAPPVKFHLDAQMFRTMDLGNRKHSALVPYHCAEEIHSRYGV